MRRRLAAILLLMIFPSFIHAQQTNSTVSPAATTVFPPVMVLGTNKGTSLTSPSFAEEQKKKREVPGTFSVIGIDDLNQSRASSLDDLLQNAPGVIMLSENETEVSKIYIRGYGVIQEDEPSSVFYLLDGLTLNQADGEMIIEDLDVGTFKDAEIYRGADALKFG